MASGRSVYFYGVLPGRTILTPLQNLIHLNSSTPLDPGEFKYCFEYTIPVNYEFIMTSYILTCNNPGRNYFNFSIDGDIKEQVYFDTLFQTVHDPDGLIIIDSGSVLRFKVRNADTIALAVMIQCYGYLHYLKI